MSALKQWKIFSASLTLPRPHETPGRRQPLVAWANQMLESVQNEACLATVDLTPAGIMLLIP